MGRYDDSQSRFSPAVVIGIVVAVIALAWFALQYGGNDGAGEGVVSELPLPASEPAPNEDEPELPDSGMAESEGMAGDEPEQRATAQAPAPLPPLEQSDDRVRRDIVALSPNFSEYLQTDRLLEKYLHVVNDFSQGQRPYKHIRFLQPSAPFVAEQDGQGWFIAESGYRRYDGLAKAFADIDAVQAVETYRRLGPLLRQVYADFGYPEHYRLDDLFKKAAAEILAAPIVEGRVALVRPSVRYQFADKKLEALSPVQKQMLRMGPANTRIIQNKLRQLVQELVNAQDE